MNNTNDIFDDSNKHFHMNFFGEEPQENPRVELNIACEYHAKDVEKREALSEAIELDKDFDGAGGGQILSVLAEVMTSQLVGYELTASEGGFLTPSISLKVFCQGAGVGEYGVYGKIFVSASKDLVFAKLEGFINQLKLRLVESLKELGSARDEKTEPRNGM